MRKRAGGGGAGTGAGSGSHKPLRAIPDKLYFRIGEVAELCEVPAYVLRFWEGEFPQLKPNKGGTGQRLYRRRDVEMALRIKTLLYDEGYTIPGARQAFKAELRGGKELQPGNGSNPGAGAGEETVNADHLRALQKELRELHALLSRPPAPGRDGKNEVRSIRREREAEPLPEVQPEKPALATLVPFARPKLATLQPRQPGPHDLFPNIFPDDSAS